MKQGIVVASLLLLAACQSAPSLEEDARYVQLAKVVDVHVYTETERKEAKRQSPGDSGVGIGIGVGVGGGTGGSFGGVMFGTGSRIDRNETPQVADGANRFTVETVNNRERIEVLSYGTYKVGDCVKVLIGHPTEYARLFDLRPGEHCD